MAFSQDAARAAHGNEWRQEICNKSGIKWIKNPQIGIALEVHIVLYDNTIN